MNELSKYAVMFVKGVVGADTFVDTYMRMYSKNKENANWAEIGVYSTSDMYNPDSEREDDELDENGLRAEVALILEKQHPLYDDLEYLALNLFSKDEIETFKKEVKRVF